MRTDFYYEGPPENRTDSPSASIVQIDPGKLMAIMPWFVMATVLAITAMISVAIVYKDLWDKFTMTENENRMLEMYVMELDGKLVSKGILKVDETYISVRPKMIANQPQP